MELSRCCFPKPRHPLLLYLTKQKDGSVRPTIGWLVSLFSCWFPLCPSQVVSFMVTISTSTSSISSAASVPFQAHKEKKMFNTNILYYFHPDTFEPNTEDDLIGVRTPSSSLLLRAAVRVSRASWFTFLRRVFHYQNDSRSHVGSNPFNSGTWMALELLVLLLQISVISISISKGPKPVWYVTLWMLGYDIGCVLSLPLLFWQYLHVHVHLARQNVEAQPDSTIHEESRSSNLMNKWRTCLELFFAIWFVMGTVWVYGSRAPKRYMLCIYLLVWNGLTYSFPFLLFLLFCCCVPMINTYIGYNMSMGSFDRGATDDRMSKLHSWRYKEVDAKQDHNCHSDVEKQTSKCSICLARYRDKEELRQLPCSHVFHLKCVDRWLRIVAYCPLCKQELER